MENDSNLLVFGSQDKVHFQVVILLIKIKADNILTESKHVDGCLLCTRLKSNCGNISKLICYALPSNTLENQKNDSIKRMCKWLLT